MTHDKTSSLPSSGDTATTTSQSESITTISPVTGKPILTRQSATASQIAQLPTTARNAFTSFRQSHPTLSSRIEIVQKFLGLLAHRTTDLAQELGGKDPAYVREDFAGDEAGIKWAASEIVDGAIFNSGQSCCAIERVYVHEKVYDQFLAACKAELAGYRVGNPSNTDTQIGPVVSKRAKEMILKQVSDAVKQGAKDETPANTSFANLDPAGNYVAPVLLSGVTHQMDVMMDETFGPVIPVMKVGSDDEAIAAMNDSPFGLTASVWTKDAAKGEGLIRHIEAGTVFVNRADFPSPDLAWTGWKDSGKGVTLSRFGFEQFVKVKSVHVKQYPN